jgi:predicted Zn-dependent peptidase
MDIAGISHFLEHMFFKGAEKYPTPKAVAEAVDSFGGEFNAFTGKEYAGYYVKSGAQNLEKSLDVLSDMLLHSKFNPREIDHERGVILEEMAMYLDMPTYQISWDFEGLVFGDQPLGRDQIGTRELIKSVTQQQFQEYQKKLYTPDNLVITIAGAVDENSLDLVEKFFTMNGDKKAYEPKNSIRISARKNSKFARKKPSSTTFRLACAHFRSGMPNFLR